MALGRVTVTVTPGAAAAAAAPAAPGPGHLPVPDWLRLVPGTAQAQAGEAGVARAWSGPCWGPSEFKLVRPPRRRGKSSRSLPVLEFPGSVGLTLSIRCSGHRLT